MFSLKRVRSIDDARVCGAWGIVVVVMLAVAWRGEAQEEGKGGEAKPKEAAEKKAEERAAGPGQMDLTASELFEKGREAFDAGEWATAEEMFERFERDFGASDEAKGAVASNVPLLALCKVQLKKFDEAGGLIDLALGVRELDRRVRGELRFWRGICHMQAKEYTEAQHVLGRFYQDPTNDLLKRREALILFGTCYTMAGFEEAAAEFYAAQIPRLREEPGGAEAAARAVVLQLYALIRSGRNELALDLVREQYPRLDEVTQLVSFQAMTLDLGSRFLEAKDYHRAIACLQRVWSRERLIRHQEDRLAMMRERREILARRLERRAALFTLDGMMTRVERELDGFRETENFDSALRLRLATAFQGLGRSREAALVLEDMLVRLEPDAIVEGATVALMQNWMEIERWPKAVETADVYVEKFGDWEGGKNVPLVMFLKGQALQSDAQHAEAAEVYEWIATAYPDSEMAPKAQFMSGFVMLLEDRHEEALEVFARFADEYPKATRLIEDADYWQGATLSLRKEYEAARAHLEDYLERYGKGGARYQTEAVFRIAFCTHALADYEGSIAQFDAFLAEHGEDPLADEARVLLGDALLGVGEIERGIATFKEIRPEATRFFEDGWFKTGKALRMTEDVEGMRAHFEEFVARYPGSSRLPEAIYWIGWTHRTEGDPAKAKAIYWETLKEHGDDAELFAMADILMALPKLYGGERGREELLEALEAMGVTAASEGRETLAFRCLWARANLMEAVNPAASRGLLLEASKKVDVKRHNPMLVADCADALREAKNYLLAEEMYDGLRKWHPRAVQKDVAYAGLGLIARERGEADKAVYYFEKFERATAGSVLLGEMLLAKASLLAEEGRRDLAMEALEGLLENAAVTSEDKARALKSFGDLWWEAGDYRKAAAYYERIYVAYGRYRGLVAGAYYRRGQALEKLSMPEKALAVYKELAGREDLKEMEEARRVRADIARLELEASEKRGGADAL